MPYKCCFVAYCCEPGRGSEWGLGWSFVQELSRTQPTWVVAHEDCKPALDKYLAERHSGQAVYPVYVKLPRWLGWMRNSYYSLFNAHYYLWQFAAAKALRRLHRHVQLDLVQHVSLSRWWMPSAGATLAGRNVAFVFGPVGGGELLPKHFRQGSPLVSRIADAMRWVGRTICRRDPLLVRTIRKADLLVAAIPVAKAWFERYGVANIDLDTPATCSTQEIIDAATLARANRPADRPFTFASCGGLSYYRGVDLALRAFAKANIPNSKYLHACDGPMRPALEQLARDLGIADRVEFLGDRPHAECVAATACADAVVHTVLRDSQGVVPDVLRVGAPVITLDHLTPAMLITPECGHLIPINDDTTPQKIVDDLAAVMTQWHADPALLAAKSAAAVERGRTFLPESRGAVLRDTHERALRSLRARTSTPTPPAITAPGIIGRSL